MSFWNFVTDPATVILWLIPAGINLTGLAIAVLSKKVGPQMLQDVFGTDGLRQLADDPSSAWVPFFMAVAPIVSLAVAVRFLMEVVVGLCSTAWISRILRVLGSPFTAYFKRALRMVEGSEK